MSDQKGLCYAIIRIPTLAITETADTHYLRAVMEVLRVALALKAGVSNIRSPAYEILRFLYWEEMDVTNNLAEWQLRPNLVTRKAGGATAPTRGADAHAILGSILVMCRRQAVGILDYLIKLLQFGDTPPSLVSADMVPS